MVERIKHICLLGGEQSINHLALFNFFNIVDIRKQNKKRSNQMKSNEPEIHLSILLSLVF